MNYTNILRETANSFLSNPTWDILLLIFFFAAVFVYGLMVGRNRMIVLLFASYPAALINEYIKYPDSFLENLNIAQTIFLKSFSFFVLAVLVFWVLKKSGFSRKELNKKTSHVLFLSFLNVGLWANIFFGHALSLGAEIIKLAPLNKLLFGSNYAHIIWLVLPILALFWLEKN